MYGWAVPRKLDHYAFQAILNMIGRAPEVILMVTEMGHVGYLQKAHDETNPQTCQSLS